MARGVRGVRGVRRIGIGWEEESAKALLSVGVDGSDDMRCEVRSPDCARTLARSGRERGREEGREEGREGRARGGGAWRRESERKIRRVLDKERAHLMA